MAKALNFDTGVIEYEVNGGAIIRFNPADTVLVKNLSKLFEKLGEEQEQTAGDDVFKTLEEKDRAMRKDIDSVFGDGTSTAVFGSMGLYALAGGLPLWANFLLAVLDEVDSSIQAQERAASPRVEYYMAKYAKYQKK